MHWLLRSAVAVHAPICAASTSSGAAPDSSAPARAEPLLVTDLSGQGQLVRLVLADLLATHRVPPAALVTITRAPEKVAEFQRRGVRVLPADFESADSVRQAFSGARALCSIVISHYHLLHSLPHWLLFTRMSGPTHLYCSNTINLDSVRI